MKNQVEKPEAELCNYKGVRRYVHPEVCKWHLERKDPECLACRAAENKQE